MTSTATRSNELTKNCPKHGIQKGYMARADGRQPWVRCSVCHNQQASQSRKARLTRGDQGAGRYFNGQRTTAGIDTVKQIYPIATELIEWIDSNHAAKGMTKTLLVNKLLARAVKLEDPSVRLDDDLDE